MLKIQSFRFIPSAFPHSAFRISIVLHPICFTFPNSVFHLPNSTMHYALRAMRHALSFKHLHPLLKPLDLVRPIALKTAHNRLNGLLFRFSAVAAVFGKEFVGIAD